MICNTDKNYKHEKDIPSLSKPIPIKRVNSHESQSNNSNFDPSKSSPPNDFMIKLVKRMNQFNNSVNFSAK